MNKHRFWAMFAIALALSEPAQCAAAETTRNPLTAAEKAQCQTQLTEFNQGVRNYNAQLGEIKTLEAEVDLLSAEIEKEQAAVDRRDSVAMDALNAKIGKNNELVARHEKMSESINAMGNESKERAAQFTEACENRSPALPMPPKSLPSASSCGSTTGAKGVAGQTEATFEKMRADEKRHQAELERVTEERAKAQSWNAEKRSKVYLNLISSPKFMAFEREKQPHMQELMRILGSKPKNTQEECRLTERIAAMLPSIKAINARQYAFMADHVKASK